MQGVLTDLSTVGSFRMNSFRASEEEFLGVTVVDDLIQQLVQQHKVLAHRLLAQQPAVVLQAVQKWMLGRCAAPCAQGMFSTGHQYGPAPTAGEMSSAAALPSSLWQEDNAP